MTRAAEKRWLAIQQLKTYSIGDALTVTTPGGSRNGTVTAKLAWHRADPAIMVTLEDDSEAVTVSAEQIATGTQAVERTPIVVEKHDQPMPGDAVELAVRWKWGQLDGGKIGVINGSIGRYPEHGHASITFNASTFRDDRIVSSSGGPGTFSTDLSLLRSTDRRTTLQVWRWKDGWPDPGNALHYQVSVAVWRWRPDH